MTISSSERFLLIGYTTLIRGGKVLGKNILTAHHIGLGREDRRAMIQPSLSRGLSILGMGKAFYPGWRNLENAMDPEVWNWGKHSIHICDDDLNHGSGISV